MIRLIRDADAVIIGWAPIYPLTRGIIEATQKLKIIARFGVGLDRIDVKAATERGIVVTNLLGTFGHTVAEHTLFLIFAVARRVTQANKFVRTNQWKKFSDLGPSIELQGKILGIIGLGEIGTEVARLARAIGMRVLYFDSTRKAERERSLHIQYLSITDEDIKNGSKVPEKLLKKSDFISLHIPLTEQTKLIIGRKEIASMKDGVFFVNTSRGGLVDEEALYEALTSGKIAGAGLDVLTKEPPDADNPLLRLDSVVFTPHCAAFTSLSFRKAWIACAKAIASVFQGKVPKPPINIVNPSVALWREH